MPERPPCLAYVVSEYPTVSHTFIQREIQELTRRGVKVKTFSVRRPNVNEALSSANRESTLSTVYLRDGGAGRIFALNLVAALTHPIAYPQTMAWAIRKGHGLRGRVWQVFYLLQAIVLWHHCRAAQLRHVHAHFANNGADVARLVAAFGNRAKPALPHP